MADNQWSESLRARAAEILARVKAEDGDTALRVLLEIREKGYKATLDGEQIRITPGGLPDDLRVKIKKHKFHIMALIRPMPKPTFPIDWHQEWLLEMDTVYRRQAAAWTNRAKQLYGEIAATKCESDDEWINLYRRLAAADATLRDAGEFPPIAYMGAEPCIVYGRTEQPAPLLPATSDSGSSGSDSARP